MEALLALQKSLEWDGTGLAVVHLDRFLDPESQLEKFVEILQNMEIEKDGKKKVLPLPYALRNVADYYLPIPYNQEARTVLENLPTKREGLMQYSLQEFFAQSSQEGCLWSDEIVKEKVKRVVVPLWLCNHPTNYVEIGANPKRMNTFQIFLAPYGSPVCAYPELQTSLAGSYHMSEFGY